MGGFSLTQEERVALTFIAHNDPRDGFVRRTWLEFKTALCGLLQRTRGNGWISVKERLPEEDRLVLVIDEGGTNVGSYSPMLDDWWSLQGDRMAPGPTVTHWMPIPEPPEVADASPGLSGA